jgi:hypothetical protein
MKGGRIGKVGAAVYLVLTYLNPPTQPPVDTTNVDNAFFSFTFSAPS